MFTAEAQELEKTSTAIKRLHEEPKRGRSRSTSEMARIHVAIPDELASRLRDIQESTYAGSVTEVIKNALVLYAALLDEHKNGRYVFTQGADGKDTHRIPIFL